MEYFYQLLFPPDHNELIKNKFNEKGFSAYCNSYDGYFRVGIFKKHPSDRVTGFVWGNVAWFEIFHIIDQRPFYGRTNVVSEVYLYKSFNEVKVKIVNLAE